MIRATTTTDAIAITSLAAANHFEAEEIELIQQSLQGYLDSKNNELWLSALTPESEMVGVLYCKPEPMTQGTWNILMLLVHPDRHRQGYGKALMTHLETLLQTQHNARLIIVETSSLDDFAPARAFYDHCGYVEAARLKDFYEKNNDKLIFRKDLNVKNT